MTYLDLIRNADYKLDNDAITLGEYEQMIEPLNREIQPEPDCALPEIIRCKNCKYWVVEEDGAYCYRIVMVHGAKDGSGFCSDAERAN